MGTKLSNAKRTLKKQKRAKKVKAQKAAEMAIKIKIARNLKAGKKTYQVERIDTFETVDAKFEKLISDQDLEGIKEYLDEINYDLTFFSHKIRAYTFVSPIGYLVYKRNLEGLKFLLDNARLSLTGVGVCNILAPEFKKFSEFFDEVIDISEIMLASLLNEPEILELLIKKSKVRKKEISESYYGISALCCAAMSNSYPCLKILLDNGADPNVLNEMAEPLEIAVSFGDINSVKILLEHGADVNSRGSVYSEGHYSLFDHCRLDDAERIQLLKSYGGIDFEDIDDQMEAGNVDYLEEQIKFYKEKNVLPIFIDYFNSCEDDFPPKIAERLKALKVNLA